MFYFPRYIPQTPVETRLDTVLRFPYHLPDTLRSS